MCSDDSIFPLYCMECGCEIRCCDDWGYEAVEVETSKIYAGAKKPRTIRRPVFVCRSCLDEFGEGHHET